MKERNAVIVPKTMSYCEMRQDTQRHLKMVQLRNYFAQDKYSILNTRTKF